MSFAPLDVNRARGERPVSLRLRTALLVLCALSIMGHRCGGGGNPAPDPPILTITTVTETTISGTVSECVDNTPQNCDLRVRAVAQGGGINDPVEGDGVVILPQPGGPWTITGLTHATTYTIIASAFDGGKHGIAPAVDVTTAAVPGLPPVLQSPPSCPANANPCTVFGTGQVGYNIAVFVNGRQQPGETAVAPGGTFQVEVALDDGANTITATTVLLGTSSAPSNALVVSYTNDIPDASRSFSGTLPAGTHTVWTSGGAPGFSGPYSITDDLTIPSGSTLTIQAGVTLLFEQSFYDLEVDGELRILGDPAPDEVTITRDTDTGTSCSGSWSSIRIGVGGKGTIEYAKMRCAKRAIYVSSGTPAGELVLRDSTIENPLTDFTWPFQIDLRNGTTSLLERNTIEVAENNTGINIEAVSYAGIFDNTITTTERGSFPIYKESTGGIVEIIGNNMMSLSSLSSTSTAIAIDSGGDDSITIADNTLDDWRVGIDIDGCPGVMGPTITGNTITDSVFAGISLEDACPHLSGNSIFGNGSAENGIFLDGNSTPLIDGGNIITGNDVGILFNGISLTPKPLPVPTINGNFIHNNSVANLYFEDLVSDPGADFGAAIDATGNYWGATTIPAIKATIVDDNAIPVALDLSGFTDSQGTTVGGSGIFSYVLKDISLSSPHFAPALGETVNIGFDLLAPAQTVSIAIYEERDDVRTTPVWSTSLSSVAAGVQSIEWNGRRTDNSLVPDDGYAYVIQVTDNFGVTHDYDPVRPPDNFLDADIMTDELFNNLPTDHNAHQGDFWAVTLDPNIVSRLLGTAEPVDEFGFPTGPVVTWIDEIPIWAGFDHPAVWDGRDSAGAIVEGRVDVLLRGVAMYPNSVVVKGSAPVVTSPETASKNVHVRSDPWLVSHSYDQVANIAFCLDQPANVTLRIHEPGPLGAAPVVDTLLDAVPYSAVDCAGGDPPHTVQWLGHSVGGDTNQMQSLVEGTYGFVLEAESQAVPGTTSIYRGVLQVLQ